MNKLQYDGTVQEIGGLCHLAEKIEAFGWEVVQVDGHNVRALLNAYHTTSKGKPLAILADTIKGKGVSFMENNPLWHHSELKEELYQKAKAEVLGEE